MRRPVGVLAVLLLLGACGNDSGPAATAPRQADALTGSLTVFAAASLTEAFTDAKATMERGHTGLTITYNFAGSQALAQQITDGAPADVVATADTTTMQKLQDAQLVEAPTVFAHNTLAIAVAPGNPKHIARLADLARPDVIVVLADPSVPVGKYAAAALAHAGVTVHPRSLELDVKAALAKVKAGEADAAIVYVTDARATGAKAGQVAIAAADNQPADYPIAVVNASTHKTAARALLRELSTGAGRTALRARGFRTP
ncbi:MAG: molybdate transport system substrate-binding protein [Actinomycetota bacterium]|jgi:molybdate transport system substrate-binding protein